MQDFLAFLDAVDGFLYYPVLIVVLIAGGLYFSFKSKFAQVRLVFDSVKLIAERPGNKNAISSFGALMVSTASRVGTGNIIGVSAFAVLVWLLKTEWFWKNDANGAAE